MTVFILSQRKFILGIAVDFIETVFHSYEDAEKQKSFNEANGSMWVIQQASVR